MKTRLFYALTVLLLAALACSFPGMGSAPGVPADAGQPLTAAAETVQAVISQTQAAAGAAPSDNTAAPAEPPTAAPSDTPPPSSTATLTATPTLTLTPRPCNQATFVTDVTIPDGTELPPNDIFIKTWRLKNVGTCSWTTSYALIFSSGDQMNGPAVQQLTQVVNPGETVDISVELIAPTTPGTYRGYWRLRDASGNSFGLTNGNDFWVEIKVVESPTAAPPPLTPIPPIVTIVPLPTVPLPTIFPIPTIVIFPTP